MEIKAAFTAGCVPTEPMRWNTICHEDTVTHTLNDIDVDQNDTSCKPLLCLDFENKSRITRIAICSNAKFVEIFSFAESRSEGEYCGTLKCCIEPSNFVSEEHKFAIESPQNISCVKLELKFLSIKRQHKSLFRIHNIVIVMQRSRESSTKLVFDAPTQDSNPDILMAVMLSSLGMGRGSIPTLLDGASPSLSQIEESQSQSRLYVQPAQTSPDPPTRIRLPLKCAEIPTVDLITKQLDLFKNQFLGEIDLLIDSKLRPVSDRLFRLEQLVSSILEESGSNRVGISNRDSRTRDRLCETHEHYDEDADVSQAHSVDDIASSKMGVDIIVAGSDGGGRRRWHDDGEVNAVGTEIISRVIESGHVGSELPFLHRTTIYDS